MNASESKTNAAGAESGPQGQRYLASGESVALRLWSDQEPAEPDAPVSRPYETVGYVIGGRAELRIDGKTIALEPGDSWVVPREAAHTYVIRERFTAVEATSPPARRII